MDFMAAVKEAEEAPAAVNVLPPVIHMMIPDRHAGY